MGIIESIKRAFGRNVDEAGIEAAREQFEDELGAAEAAEYEALAVEAEAEAMFVDEGVVLDARRDEIMDGLDFVHPAGRQLYADKVLRTEVEREMAVESDRRGYADEMSVHAPRERGGEPTDAEIEEQYARDVAAAEAYLAVADPLRDSLDDDRTVFDCYRARNEYAGCHEEIDFIFRSRCSLDFWERVDAHSASEAQVALRTLRAVL